MQKISVIDSHTEGEPTRVVIAGSPLSESLSATAALLELQAKHDGFRSAVVNEPRGFDAMVGALLLEPTRADTIGGVVYFNNVGYLGMCVHGTIGLAQTLHHLGRLKPGPQRLETAVGDVEICLQGDGSICVVNVESYRIAKQVAVETAEHGVLHGDIAWGGNWFFLCDDHGLALDFSNLSALKACSRDLMDALEASRVTGEQGKKIDHIELFGSAQEGGDSRNFVLCPGGEYDRSPCGTGTSAKLACLAADGKLKAGEVWRQESILGTIFEGRIQASERGVIPSVSGRAWVTAESTLILRDDDPFREGIK